MSAPAARMLVLCADEFCCIRIVGRASFSSGVDFQALLNGLLAKGCRRFVLDLGECALMDSTFLGLLAGYGGKSGGLPGPGERPIQLHGANPRIVELLENLGVLSLFKITAGPLVVPGGAREVAVDAGHASKRELTQTCLDAHRTLMELNPDNVARFK